LVVEIADSTLERDRAYKAPIYARAGIPEYWIVNLVERRLEIYRDPIGSPGRPARYQVSRSAAPTETISPLSLPQISNTHRRFAAVITATILLVRHLHRHELTKAEGNLFQVQ
jgi:Uma2 family endonuclease